VIDRFEQFLDTMPANGIRGLVIDLRGNSGGRVDLGTRLLNRFIDSGPLFDQVDRNGRHMVQMAHGTMWNPAVPVVVLIDQGTASMAEIFAQALREHGMAYIVGETSSGSVAGAQVFPLGDGSAMELTVLDILSGQGVKLNKVGITPDLAISPTQDDVETGRDVQLDAAVAHVRSELASQAAAA
jgi:carboxyl-terminal processing protease